MHWPSLVQQEVARNAGFRGWGAPKEADDIQLLRNVLSSLQRFEALVNSWSQKGPIRLHQVSNKGHLHVEAIPLQASQVEADRLPYTKRLCQLDKHW